MPLQTLRAVLTHSKFRLPGLNHVFDIRIPFFVTFYYCGIGFCLAASIPTDHDAKKRSDIGSQASVLHCAINGNQRPIDLMGDGQFVSLLYGTDLAHTEEGTGRDQGRRGCEKKLWEVSFSSR